MEANQRSDDSTDPIERRAPITDSPWFWAYLFATGALLALLLAGPKYAWRQTQIERQYTARQMAGQTRVGERGPAAASTEARPIVSLRPLYGLLGVAIIAAWIGLWATRLRINGRRPRATAASPKAM